MFVPIINFSFEVAFLPKGPPGSILFTASLKFIQFYFFLLRKMEWLFYSSRMASMLIIFFSETFQWFYLINISHNNKVTVINMGIKSSLLPLKTFDMNVLVFQPHSEHQLNTNFFYLFIFYKGVMIMGINTRKITSQFI